MTLAEAIADVEQTVAIWRASGVSASEAWLALTGRRKIAKWQAVQATMIRIALGQQPMRPRMNRRPRQRYMRFRDDPRAIRDHGPPHRLWAA